MTGGIRQTELLAELHADTSTAVHIQALLDAAVEHDIVARAKRRQAGRLLAELRSKEPARWRELADVNDKLAELLLNMASGRN